METYIKKLINRLCEVYVYNIIEFGEIPGLASTWGVVKRTEDFAEIMFFSNTNNSEILNKENFIKLLKNGLQCEHIRIIEILIHNEDTHKTYPQCELIIINTVDNKVIYYTNGLEDKVQQLENCMNFMNVVTPKPEKTGRSIITYILIGVNVLAYILTAYLSSSIIDSNINVLVLLGAKVNQLIDRGEYYRLITCMFLHGGIIHLALNMYALNSLGPFVEKVYGKTKYLIIYFLAGIMSSIFSYKFSTGVSIGATGAIFGLLGAALVFALKMKHRIGKDFIINIMSVIAINLVIGFSIANVDNFGHLGGLIGGTIITLLIGKGNEYY